MDYEGKVRTVAVIGAGAAGAVMAAALKAENYFNRIQVFERRGTAGGTWIYDAEPSYPAIRPGALPPDIDIPLDIPNDLPRTTPPNHQERFSQTPIYSSLTTNVPDIAMSFSDAHFAYGPFAPHYIPRQYLENYFSINKTDSYLELNTTVEDITKLTPTSGNTPERWKLTLRRYDIGRHVDLWWEDDFDAVILATGHYSIPYIPPVNGLEAYIIQFPDRVSHSKSYRKPEPFSQRKVLIIGNSASGHDLTVELLGFAHSPVYQSRRSKSRWDNDEPPPGIVWKPIVRDYLPTGRIVFEDDTYLDDVDAVIYCTGYKPSFPFWNSRLNGRPLWDYKAGKLNNVYLHTFFQDFKTLAIVGMPRSLTFRSFEYQAIAIARVFAERTARSLPPLEEQKRWEREREEKMRKFHKKFHDIPWEDGQTLQWLDELFKVAGLGTIKGEGRIPPVLGKDLIWAVEHLKKYPEPDKMEIEGESRIGNVKDEMDWVVVRSPEKGLLDFL